MYKIISIKQQLANIEKLFSLRAFFKIIDELAYLLDKSNDHSHFSGKFFPLIKVLNTHAEKNDYFKSYGIVIDLIDKLLFPAKFDTLEVSQNMFQDLKNQCEKVKETVKCDMFFLEVKIQFELNCPILIQDEVLKIFISNDNDTKELSFELNSKDDCFASIKEDLKELNNSIKAIFLKLTENLSSDFNELLDIIVETQKKMESLYESEKTRCNIKICTIS